MKIAKEFDTKWDFPHTLGALDGKTHHAGSKYYNCKKFHNIVLMALVDADYELIYIDVVCNGRMSDGGVLAGCSLSEALHGAIANVPGDASLPDEETIMSFHLVVDDAFPLKTWLMKPLPFRNLTPGDRIYIYRLSRARRIVENAFGILVAKFRVFLLTMVVMPERAERIVLAACVVITIWDAAQNAVTSRVIDDQDSSDKTARQNAALGLRPAIIAPHSNFTGYDSREKRQQRIRYFAEKGAVSWQNDMVWSVNWYGPNVVLA